MIFFFNYLLFFYASLLHKDFRIDQEDAALGREKTLWTLLFTMNRVQICEPLSTSHRSTEPLNCIQQLQLCNSIIFTKSVLLKWYSDHCSISLLIISSF